MWGSLKKFVGDDDPQLDATWNPRNKLLADMKFTADMIRYDCDEDWEKNWAGSHCVRDDRGFRTRVGIPDNRH